MISSPVLTLLLYLVSGWVCQINGIGTPYFDQITEQYRCPRCTSTTQSLRGPDGRIRTQNPRTMDCNGFPGKITAGDYRQTAKHAGFTPARYIWPSKIKSDVLFLHCYMDQDPATRETFYIAVIKTLENEAIFSVIGFRCLPEKDLYENHYIRVVKNGNKRTFHVGARFEYEQPWCRAAICVDCGDTSGKPDQGGGQQGELVHWSRGAVEWKRGVTKDYDYSREWVAKQFVSIGKTKFVLVCIKDETEKTGQVVRSASGAFIVKVNFIFDCKQIPNHFLVQMFFVTESSDGKLSFFTNEDCDRGCQVDVGGDVDKSWLYYYERNTRLRNADESVPFLFYFRLNDDMKNPLEQNSCQWQKRQDIRITTSYAQPQSYPAGMYSSGQYFKIACFNVHLSTRTEYYADIVFKDDRFISIANYNCEASVASAGTPNIFVTTTNNDDDVSQVVIGSYDPEWTNNWCVYNVIKMPDSDTYDIELYYGYKPDPSVLRWIPITA